MQKTIFWSCFLIIALLFLGCTTPQVVENTEPVMGDDRYDSEFPSKSISSQLDFVSNTIKKLDVLVFYETFSFPENNSLDETALSSEELKSQSLGSSISNEAVLGTASIVYFDGEKVGLLTCAHVIDFPDTIVERYDNGTGPIQSISIKVRQRNAVVGLPDGGEVKLIATDPGKDIAFLSKSLDKPETVPKVLNFPVGNTRDLEWGSVVYVMGFPGGQKMVTRAIVSNPRSGNKIRFTTDALYNRGFSGAPVLAIRDGAPNFELIGMATSAAVNKIYYTKPGIQNPDIISPNDEYTGSLKVDHVNNIIYGVTFNLTIEAINKFFKNQSEVLEQHGFIINRMFK